MNHKLSNPDHFIKTIQEAMGQKCLEFDVHDQIHAANDNQCLTYALTVTYHKAGFYNGQNSIRQLEAVNDHFKQVYKVIARSNGDKHWQRHEQLHPLCLYFVDVSHTRHRQKKAYHAGDNPHHHAVLVFHPRHAALLAQAGFVEKHGENVVRRISAVETVDLQPLYSPVDLAAWGRLLLEVGAESAGRPSYLTLGFRPYQKR